MSKELATIAKISIESGFTNYLIMNSNYSSWTQVHIDGMNLFYCYASATYESISNFPWTAYFNPETNALPQAERI